MNLDLSDRLSQRVIEGELIRIGLIGAGKFATMFLSQARLTKGFHIVAVADLDYNRANKAIINAGYNSDIIVNDFEKAISTGGMWFTQNGIDVAACEQLDVIIEATGNPEVGVSHALAAFNVQSHVILVTVEADALCGAALIKRASSAGVVCSMAYGDQPALICELVEKIRTSGFELVCAGKGTKYLPEYHKSTTRTVWDYYGISKKDAVAQDLNAQMFNSFLDGTKSAIEMTAVANATDLSVPKKGLSFPPVGTSQLAEILKPKELGGILENSGTVEVVSSLTRNGSEIFDHLRFGVFVVFRGSSPYISKCFKEYGIPIDKTGEYAALWRPVHLIGLELGVSVAKVVLDKQPTGSTKFFRGDTVSVAKKNLSKGEILDGEGGTTVWGKLIPSADSIAIKALPIGLAHKIKMIKNVSEGDIVTISDVDSLPESDAFKLRKEMEEDYLI